MSIKNVYEVLDDFRNAKTKQDRLDILRRNGSFAVKSILQGALDPRVKFTIKEVPKYNKVDVPAGMSYSHMTDALSRVYLWTEGNPKRPAGLTEKRSTELLLQLLESLEPKEAEVFANMIQKDLKIPHLTVKLVNEAFPGLLPE